MTIGNCKTHKNNVCEVDAASKNLILCHGLPKLKMYPASEFTILNLANTLEYSREKATCERRSLAGNSRRTTAQSLYNHKSTES